MLPRIPLQAVSVRVGASLFGNVARSGLAFASGIITARALGPSAYGDLGFLLGSFVALGSLLDMGTSSAFYTFLAQRPRSRGFLLFYGAWTLVQFAVPALAILALPSGAFAWIWLDHSRRIVLVAFVASFLLTQVWGALTQLAEARRLTVLIQAATIAQALAHLLLIATAAYFHWLSVTIVLMFTATEYAACAFYLLPRLARPNIDADAPRVTFAETVTQFGRYCRPLVIYGWFSFGHMFVDRWLLQRYGGSVQQGFFSVANQFAMIGGILTAAVGKVLWKEIAEARETGDAARVGRLYESVTRGLYFAVAWLCCLLIPYASEILRWTIGDAFAGASLAFTLMLVYPVHQAVGQTQSTLFYASEDTAMYARIGLWTMGLSVPVTYLMLAPHNARIPGLALGATGLAIKMVLLNIGGVSVQEAVIARRHGWSSALSTQAAILLFLLATGWLARRGVIAISHGLGATPPAVAVVSAGIGVYAVVTAAAAFRFSRATGVDALLRSISVWSSR